MSRREDPFQDIERLFDQLAEFGGQTGGDIRVDIVDEGEEFVVTADLPGYTAEDIEVELPDDRHLQIAAEFDRSESRESADFVVRERRRQSASRTVALPEPVDENETEASYDNGILTVRLGKQGASDDGTDIEVT